MNVGSGCGVVMCVMGVAVAVGGWGCPAAPGANRHGGHGSEGARPTASEHVQRLRLAPGRKVRAALSLHLHVLSYPPSETWDLDLGPGIWDLVPKTQGLTSLGTKGLDLRLGYQHHCMSICRYAFF